MGKNSISGHDRLAWMGTWGRLDGDRLGSLARLGAKIITRQIGCFVLALLFSIVVVAPIVLTVADRAPPFEYNHPYPAVPFVHPGQPAIIVVRVKDYHRKADGEFTRYFTDSTGERFYMGSHRVSYSQGLKATDGRVFLKEWTPPFCAAAGPGIYEARAEFWYNSAQWLISPIQATPMVINVTVVRDGPIPTECVNFQR